MSTHAPNAELDWLGRPIAVVLSAALVASCGNGVPVRTEEAQPLAVVSPPNEPSGQFAVAVQNYARQTELERTVHGGYSSYEGIQLALQDLADALVLVPRGADVLIARNPAGVIRGDQLRVGAGVLDNTGRTRAARHALEVATETLDEMTRGAYPNIAELPPLVAGMKQSVASIDDSQLLWTQRVIVMQSLEDALAILRTIQRASG